MSDEIKLTIIFLLVLTALLIFFFLRRIFTKNKTTAPTVRKPLAKWQKILIVVLIAFMFIPCHTTYHGGTQEWRAVTYLVMNWSKDDRLNQYTDSPQEGIKFYIFPYSLRSRSRLILH